MWKIVIGKEFWIVEIKRNDIENHFHLYSKIRGHQTKIVDLLQKS